jgi:hypothetical protein
MRFAHSTRPGKSSFGDLLLLTLCMEPASLVETTKTGLILKDTHTAIMLSSRIWAEIS